MNESKISEAEKKLEYAEYLLRRGSDGAFASGAIKHVIASASLAVQSFSDLDENKANSPRLIQQFLDKFEDEEVKDFSKFYLNMWKLASSENPSYESVNTAFTKTRKFISWLKRREANKFIIKKEEPRKLRFTDV